MAGDPLQKFIPGQPFDGLPAAGWNTFVDVARDYKQNKEARDGNGSPTAYGLPPIAVKNGSGENLPRFAVVIPDVATFQPAEDDDDEDAGARLDAFKNRRCMTVFPPGPSDDLTSFLILQEPVRAGRIGAAMLYGLTPAWLDIQSATDKFAVAISGDRTTLKTTPYGGSPIFWKPSGTGVKLGYVVLAPFQQPTFLATLTDRESNLYSWQEVGSDTEGDLNAFEEIYSSQAIPKGSIVRMRPAGSGQFSFSFDWSGQHGKAKSGGVPGRSGVNAGTATIEITDGNFNVIDELPAYNHSTAPVAASAPLMLKYIRGSLWIDWEQC